MKRNKTLLAVLLTIIAFIFVVFVVFMQQHFNNPEFVDLPSVEVNEKESSESNDDENEDEEVDGDTDRVAGALGSVVNEEEDEEEDEVEPTYSTRTVLVDTLNARSGPGMDHEITGVLVLDQVVEVEDQGDDWVRIITDEFSGYVNERYLSVEQ